MEIAIIFHTASRADACGAVWVVDSAENRIWFARQEGLDEGSAVFKPEGGEIGPAAVLRAIWDVEEHYPDWSRINVSGTSLSPDLLTALRDEGTVETTDHGFSLAR